MIEDVYLKRAISIRKEYLELNNKLKEYENHIKNLKRKIEETIENIQEIIDKKHSMSLDDIKTKSVEYLKTLENETLKIQKFVDPINDKLKKLQEEEQILYSQIKLKYSNLKNEEILSIIQNELKKQGL